MPQLFANNAFGSLASPINGAATTITLVSGDGARFPSPTGGDYFHATLVGLNANGVESSWEIVRCTARATDQLTVTRAQEGTTATSWNAGTRIELRVTKAGLDGKESAGTAAAAITTHEAAADPHPQYTTTAEAAAAAPVQSVAGKTGVVTLTKADVGLANVDNTSDATKAVLSATKLAAPRTIAGTSFDGQANIDISYPSLTGKPTLGTAAAKDVPATGDAAATQVVLGNDSRLRDARTPTAHTHAISGVTGLQTALDGKQATLVSGTNIKTINGEPVLGSGDLVIAGGGGPALMGDTAPYVTQTKTYQITNYNSFSSYAVAASAGTVSIAGDTITFTAPATPGSVDLTLTVDGQPTVFAITVQPTPIYIPTPTPTPANFGDALEGGFYAGIVWEQLTQSATSTTIGTGSKTFTVPSMISAPIVYAGQTLEVRSRANPVNKMVGTVTNASSTSLTVNVTSVGGSGTFSDWSVMARHRIIVAPKASGEHAGIVLKNTNSALPTACQTLTEGFAATQAMRDADTSTVYPAAHWARSLNIGGRTDWYIPARDELELLWRNLKPSTADNYLTADRPTAASFNYAQNGSYGDTANTHGLNNNSSPTGAAYTAAVPGQTAAAAFHTGGAEAFEFGSKYYWSSSDYNASNAWGQYWSSSYPGNQYYNIKTTTFRVRAVRRSVI